MPKYDTAPRKRPEWHAAVANDFDKRLVDAVADTTGRSGNPFEIEDKKRRVLQKLGEYHSTHGSEALTLTPEEVAFRNLKETVLQMFNEREILSTADLEVSYPSIPGMPETLDPDIKQRVFADPEVVSRIHVALERGWRKHILDSLTKVAIMGDSLDESMTVLIQKATTAGLDAATARQLVQGRDTLVKVIPLLFNHPDVSERFARILSETPRLSDAITAINEHKKTYAEDLKDRSVTYEGVLKYVEMVYAEIETAERQRLAEIETAERKRLDGIRIAEQERLAEIEAAKAKVIAEAEARATAERQAYIQQHEDEWGRALSAMYMEREKWKEFGCRPEEVTERIGWCKALRDRNLPWDLWKKYTCHPDQIADTPSRITEDTKVYYGAISPDLFSRVGHVERIIIDGNEILTRKMQVGGKTPAELAAAVANQIDSTGIFYDPNFTTYPNHAQITIVIIRVSVLLGERVAADRYVGVNMSDVLKAAGQAGLIECPSEVAVHLAMSSKHDEGPWFVPSTNAISDLDGNPLGIGARGGSRSSHSKPSIFRIKPYQLSMNSTVVFAIDNT